MQATESPSTVDESKNNDMEVEETSKNDSSKEMDISLPVAMSNACNAFIIWIICILYLDQYSENCTVPCVV